MTELEMEIGRLLGASAFFIYQTIKHNPGFTARDIEIETGLSENCVQKTLQRLRECKAVNFRLKPGTSKTQLYSPNEERETWKFH